MNYIVDTSVWSQALRREHHRETEEVRKLAILLSEGERIFLPGIILQEILQGVQRSEQFKQIREALSCFPVPETGRDDYVFAAELFNHCRSKGVQAATVDFMIASLAIRHKCLLLTSDKDFVHIARHSDLKLL
ncbi:MAG: PIN domain-containing protein [Pseudomonadota bacterium]